MREDVAALGVADATLGSLLVFSGLIGVVATGLAFAEASDMGGDGGVAASELVSAVEIDLVPGGVVIIGDDAVERGEPS